MVEHDLTVTNKLGLHARASAKLVQLASSFQSQVFLLCRGREINAKSIMGLMLAAAGKDTPIKLRIEGSDEANALHAIVDLFERKFDEGE